MHGSMCVPVCVFLHLNVFHSFAFNYPPCELAEWSCFSIFGQELSVQSVLFDLQEYVASLKAVSTSPFLPFLDSLYLLLNGCPSYVTRADEKKSWFGEAWLTDKMERTRKRKGTLFFQLIGEMKGFIVQYIAHGESRPVVIAARHK